MKTGMDNPKTDSIFGHCSGERNEMFLKSVEWYDDDNVFTDVINEEFLFKMNCLITCNIYFFLLFLN